MVIERHLRIGNFVARNDSKEFIISEVLGINRNFEWQYLIDSRNSDGRHRESLWISAKKCDPIPLTPEWLERCGLAENDRGYYVLVSGSFYLLKNDLKDETEAIDGLVLVAAGSHGLVQKPIYKYLHQLQNLFFALTGEDLNVKL